MSRYQVLSIIRVTEPLQADLITMSFVEFAYGMSLGCREIVNDAFGFGCKKIIFNCLKECIKSSVSISRRCPKTFRVERIGYIVSCAVVKELSNTHTSGKFVEIRINFAPVNTLGVGAKSKPSS